MELCHVYLSKCTEVIPSSETGLKSSLHETREPVGACDKVEIRFRVKSSTP